MPLVPSPPYQRLRDDWRDVLRRVIKSSPLKNATQTSLAAGLTHSTVGEWIRETKGFKQKSPSFDSLAQVARVLNVSLDIFVEGDAAARIAETHGKLEAASARVAPLVGLIQAGVWQEPGMLDFEEAIEVPHSPHPVYGALPQFAWRVVGSSMNRIARNGEYVIGVKLIDIGARPPENAPVVVERRRGSTYEYTAKRIRYLPDGIQLVPDSEDERFQQPVWVSNHAGDDEEVEATHLIIGVYRHVI